MRNLTLIPTTLHEHLFRCIQCGLCCEGPVELTDSDYDRILKKFSELKLKPSIEFRKRGEKLRPILKPLEKDQLTLECAFLKRVDGNRRICMIYEERPCYCRLYPLFIGLSKNLNVIYVDVLHCPGVSHKCTGKCSLTRISTIDNKYVIDTLNDILKIDPKFLDIVPNTDKAVTITLYPKFRNVYIDWNLKYSTISRLNRALCNELYSCDNLLQVIYTISRFQMKVREGIKYIDKIFELPDKIGDIKCTCHVKLKDIEREILKMFNYGEVIRDGRRIIILDNYDNNMYEICIDLEDFKDIDIDERDLENILDLLYRFSTNIQTCALPFEKIYINGYLYLIIIYGIYKSICDKECKYLYNVDAIGLSIYTRSIINLMKELNISYITIDTSCRFFRS